MSFTCKGCPDRFPGCHDKCEKYRTEKAKHEARRAQDAARRAVDSGLREQRTAAVNKAMRHRRKGKKYGNEF